MLDQKRVVQALEQKQAYFQSYAANQRAQKQALVDWLDAVRAWDAATILAMVAGYEWPGALPTQEYDTAVDLCLPFAPQWNDHQAARAWARTVLENRITVAVDGSQITPTVDYTPPVGAVQIGWFVNSHQADGRYVKDLEFDVLAPSELLDEDEEGGDETFAMQTVNQERFVRECRRLSRLMVEVAREQQAAGNGQRLPVCFFDGSFIISFAGKIQASRARHYLTAITELLETSAKFRVPLVGFVDSSRSRDVTSLFNLIRPEKSTLFELSDAALLAQQLPGWGDRSPLFICARNDALSNSGQADFYRDVVFTYVRLNRDQPPARIELPRWLAESALAEEVLDVVRAECVVGTGYPYAIETADAVAVISAQDRQRFYALFERFMADQSPPTDSEGVAPTGGANGVTMARKARSKVQRR